MKYVLVCLLAALIASGLPRRAEAQVLIVPLNGKRVHDIQAAQLFHTLFNDFFLEDDATTYVQTGDIPAMWLRDSSAQTIPYVRFQTAFPILRSRFAGVIERNAQNVLTNPYANAFRADHSVWENKWEADSLAWPVLLAWTYWETTHERMIFTPAFHEALWRTVQTWRCEQLHATCSRYMTAPPSNAAFNSNTGMIWTAFRASDDPVTYHFNIPQEAIAAAALLDVARLAQIGYGDQNLTNEALSMSAQVTQGIEEFGRVWDPSDGGWVYVYETDGLGHVTYMDDANTPNLTALPYIGFCSPYDPTYLNTRAYALSAKNPYYFSGIYAQGLGSPHTPAGFVWPLGIIARALTATSSGEVAQAITTLAQTDSQDGLIHESFWPNGYWLFTRADFGWANALYAELLFRSVAGMRAPSMLPFGATLSPFELPGVTPVLTSSLGQFQDTLALYQTLADLLEQADGHTIIPSIESQMQQSAGPGDLDWHELPD